MAQGLQHGPLVIGLIGSIRCQPSVDLLFQTMWRMGGDLQLHVAGNLHDHAVTGFWRSVAETPHAGWTGPYAVPHGLPAAYGECDLVWA